MSAVRELAERSNGTEWSFESIRVVDAPPLVEVTVPGSSPEAPPTTVIVEGVPPVLVAEMPWGPIIKFVTDILGTIKTDPPKGGGAKGCMEFTGKNPDGSSFSYKYCPPPE